MFRQILTWLAAGASAAAGLVTLAGLGAPLDPRLEMINHFRPILAAAALFLLLLSFLLRARKLIFATGALSALSLILLLAPLAFAAPSANGERPNLRIVSMNLWVDNRDLKQTAKFLLASNADVIVLQEVLCAASDPLFDDLRAAYPHIHRKNERCFGQAILSKHPMVATGREDYRHRQPIWLWAEIVLGTQRVRITGVHLSHPTQPLDQVANMGRLSNYAKDVATPHIIAGDFNLTPYSWLLNKFAYRSSLRRSGTFTASWPGHRAYPFFLIDHVFVSKEFLRANFAVGANAGSDHRPVTADLVLR